MKFLSLPNSLSQRLSSGQAIASTTIETTTTVNVLEFLPACTNVDVACFAVTFLASSMAQQLEKPTFTFYCFLIITTTNKMVAKYQSITCFDFQFSCVDGVRWFLLVLMLLAASTVSCEQLQPLQRNWPTVCGEIARFYCPLGSLN